MTGVTKLAGGAGDGGDQPTEAEGRALREVNAGGPSGAMRTSSGGGSKSDYPTRGRHGTERDYVMSAYGGTYCAYAYGGQASAKSA